MKKTLFATTALIVAGLAANTYAVDVEMYGQVSKLLVVADDGQDTTVSIMDNDRSSTRFGFKGSQALDNGLTASVLWEGEYQGNASDTLGQNTTNPAVTSATPANAPGTFNERHARVGLGGAWGALFLGNTSTATDSSAEQDLAGVGDVLGADIEDIGGGFEFLTSAGAGSTFNVNEVFTDMDGNDRTNVIRYDSPIMNGWQGRLSFAQDGDMDLGVYYDAKYDAFQVRGALGYTAYNGGSNGNPGSNPRLDSQINGSVSVKHDSGLAGTFAFGQQETKETNVALNDPSFYYFKLGYAWDAFQVAADWGKAEDNLITATASHKATTFGLGGQYDLGHGVSASAFYKNFDLDVTGTSTDSLNLFGVGMRVKF